MLEEGGEGAHSCICTGLECIPDRFWQAGLMQTISNQMIIMKSKQMTISPYISILHQFFSKFCAQVEKISINVSNWNVGVHCEKFWTGKLAQILFVVFYIC